MEERQPLDNGFLTLVSKTDLSLNKQTNPQVNHKFETRFLKSQSGYKAAQASQVSPMLSRPPVATVYPRRW